MTVKQIADTLGCPKMRVYRYIRANGITETFCNGTKCYYDDDVAANIIAALSSVLESGVQNLVTQQTVTDHNKPYQSVTETVTDRNKPYQSVTETVTDRNKPYQSVTETVTDRNTETVVIDTLRAQLSVKDSQLMEKDKQIEALTAALNKSQQALQDTTAALTAALNTAQALHAGTIGTMQQQQKLTSAVDGVSDSGVSSEDLEGRKRGFFSRIFKK